MATDNFPRIMLDHLSETFEEMIADKPFCSQAGAKEFLKCLEHLLEICEHIKHSEYLQDVFIGLLGLIKSAMYNTGGRKNKNNRRDMQNSIC